MEFRQLRFDRKLSEENGWLGRLDTAMVQINFNAVSSKICLLKSKQKYKIFATLQCPNLLKFISYGGSLEPKQLCGLQRLSKVIYNKAFHADF